MKKRGIQPEVSDEDGTVRDLISKLEDKEFQGKRVMVQLHGEKMHQLSFSFYMKKKADVLPLLPYQHTPPEPEAAETLLKEMKDGQVHAVCFTTAVPSSRLFQTSRRMGKKRRIASIIRAARACSSSRESHC
ncbi:hypothetical protein BsIDN1_35540 [Bacillus safensis]|uniref:Tetrapyrrole biosynthesis uroporphyrinogen III synthase domain-containing protein n=1 Tax=Bacillus safensis TaxID=561879 RepID=A0A5S9MEF0_BACIA|nr:hypothetical protein BsIDN1_35540 [Bacillus safensis]